MILRGFKYHAKHGLEQILRHVQVDIHDARGQHVVDSVMKRLAIQKELTVVGIMTIVFVLASVIVQVFILLSDIGLNFNFTSLY